MRTAPVGGSGDFHIPDEGTHLARFCVVIDLGTQQGGFGPKRTALVGWEICDDEPLEEGQRPDRIFQRVTWSMNEKAKMRQIIQAMTGRKLSDEEAATFDVYALAETAHPCMLQVVHNETNGSTYANYAGATGLPKGMKAPPLRGEVTLFDLDAPDWDVFNGFSDNLQNTIAASPEYGKAPTAEQQKAVNDEVPF